MSNCSGVRRAFHCASVRTSLSLSAAASATEGKSASAPRAVRSVRRSIMLAVYLFRGAGDVVSLTFKGTFDPAREIRRVTFDLPLRGAGGEPVDFHRTIHSHGLIML